MNAFIVDLEDRPGSVAAVAEAIALKGISITSLAGATGRAARRRRRPDERRGGHPPGAGRSPDDRPRGRGGAPRHRGRPGVVRRGRPAPGRRRRQPGGGPADRDVRGQGDDRLRDDRARQGARRRSGRWRPPAADASAWSLGIGRRSLPASRADERRGRTRAARLRSDRERAEQADPRRQAGRDPERDERSAEAGAERRAEDVAELERRTSPRPSAPGAASRSTVSDNGDRRDPSRARRRSRRAARPRPGRVGARIGGEARRSRARPSRSPSGPAGRTPQSAILRAWTQAPAVHDSVAPVRARPATAGPRPRQPWRASGT